MAPRISCNQFAPWLSIVAFGMLAALVLPAAALAHNGSDAGDEDAQASSSEQEQRSAFSRYLEQSTASSSFRPSDLTQLTRLLILSEEQRSALSHLLEAVQSKVRRAAESTTAHQSALRERYGSQNEYSDKSSEARQQFREYSNRQQEELVRDIQAVLSDDQLARWVKVERWLRRRDQFNSVYGPTGASRIDLAMVVESVFGSAAPGEAMGDALEAYEAEVDRVLKERETQFKAVEEQVEKQLAAIDPENEHSMVREEFDRAYAPMKMCQWAYSRKLRDLNVQTLGKLLAVIEPEDRRRDFEAEFYGRTSSAYHIGPLRACMTAALKIENLTLEQRQRLAELKTRVQVEALAHEKRLFDSACKAEDLLFAEGKLREYDYGWSHRDEDKTREEWEEKLLDSLRSILTPEQLEKMPPPLRPVEVPELEFEE